MFEVNGREIGLFYSVWAHCEYNDWIVKNQNTSVVRAIIQKAVIMSKAYCDVNGGKPLDPKEIMSLPEYVFEDLVDAVTEQEKTDCERTVEAEEPKGKNEEGAAEK